MSNSMTVYPIHALKDNYIWALVDPKSRNVVIVDPGEAQAVVNFLAQHQFTLKGILITHHHWDHTNGVAALKAQAGFIGGPLLEQVDGMNHPFEEESNVCIPGFEADIKILNIPGHTLGHIAYYISGKLFCGDTLFSAGCGRVFEGTFKQMYDTLQKLSTLPASTAIYAGHEYTLNNLRFAQTVEPDNAIITERLQAVMALREQQQPTLPSLLSIEKDTNPFLRCDQPTVIKSAQQYAGEKLTTPLEVFTCLRQWKDKF